MNRKPAAGGFYPLDKKTLKRKIDKMMKETPKKEIKPKGLIVPHAGYTYSGKTAAHAYRTLEGRKIERAIILGVNHYGVGSDAAISEQDWETPLGIMKNDTKIRRELLENEYVEIDEVPHSQEHSIEVQLPFLQHIDPDMKFVPLSLKALNEEQVKSIGKTIKEIVSRHPETVVIASSDLIHLGDKFGYSAPPGKDSLKYLKRKDKEFLNKVEERDFEGVMEIGRKSTICGYLPIAIIIKSLFEQVEEVKLLHTSNSYANTRDKSNIVGYASLILF